MTQPATNVPSRVLIRSVPCVSPQTYVGTLANGATKQFDFDGLIAVADPAFFNVGAAPTAVALQVEGQLIDWTIFSDQVGQANLYMAIDDGDTFHIAMDPEPVLVSDLFQISGFRITARYLRVAFTNTSGSLANIAMYAAVRSQ